MLHCIICKSVHYIQKNISASVGVELLALLLEEAPGQKGREAVKHTGRQVEDRAEARLQGRGAPSVDHHHLVYLLRILVGQEGTEGHPVHAEHRDVCRTG